MAAAYRKALQQGDQPGQSPQNPASLPGWKLPISPPAAGARAHQGGVIEGLAGAQAIAICSCPTL